MIDPTGYAGVTLLDLNITQTYEVDCGDCSSGSTKVTNQTNINVNVNLTPGATQSYGNPLVDNLVASTGGGSFTSSPTIGGYPTWEAAPMNVNEMLNGNGNGNGNGNAPSTPSTPAEPVVPEISKSEKILSKVSYSEQFRCMGGCHSISGYDQKRILNRQQSLALGSATLSGLGAIASVPGCYSTGVGCGLTAVLAGDSYRQFTKGFQGYDPVERFAFDRLKFNRAESKQFAIYADYATFTFSARGAYKAALMSSGSSFTAGSSGMTSADVFSTGFSATQLETKGEN